MIRRLLLLFAAVLTVVGCQQQQPAQSEERAVYYWRTELRLDSVERAFLSDHHIDKVYCRYFDVVMRDGEPMPNATIAFLDSLPQGVELVPTVYITEDCMHQHHSRLAERLVRRIAQMNETNDIGGVSEIQIDCDYTARSRQVYYDFLKEVAERLPTLDTPFSTLSVTIRLHQLAMEAPPCDYGVLMLYNTGDPRKFMERRSADGRLLEEGRNPILDLRDVQPYLKYLADYPLPMAAAYPVYLWQRTVGGVRIEHVVEAEEILRVKHAVEQRRHDLSTAVVTYHLDRENIERYNYETYEEIYRH